MPKPVEVKSIRIVSDGTIHGTKVLDGHGNSLGLVQSMHIFGEAGEDFLRVDLRVVLPEVDVEIPIENANIEEEEDAPSS